jgi:hypothetical protein
LDKGSEIAQHALYLLKALAEKGEPYGLLHNVDVVGNIWNPLVRFATPENPDPVWEEVYVLALDLTSVMLTKQKHYFLEDVLNFWGVHGSFLSFKLWSLSEMTKNCVMNDPDKNFTMMKHLLRFNSFILPVVFEMMVFKEDWRRQQKEEFDKTLVSEEV